MKKNKSFTIKANRVFTPVRKYGWIFTLLVAIGGLWFPKLGLLVLPIMLTLSLISLFKGRFWCGNFCSHGSLFDRLMLPFSKNKMIPAFFKHKVTITLFFLVFMGKIVTRFIKIVTTYNADRFFDTLGFIFVTSYLMVFIAGGLLALLISPRTWCNFCPMGAMQSFFYKLGKVLKINGKTDSKVSISDIAGCKSCAKCARVCPMQLTPHQEFNHKNQFDDSECIRCNTCVYHCPAGILSITTEKKAAAAAVNLRSKENDSKCTLRA